MDSILQHIQSNRQRYIDELSDFLRIPSVSAKSEHRSDCRRAADFLVDQFQNMGFDASVRATPGNPIVIAKYQKHPNKPTILIYGHYDVQPEEPVHLWNSPPFDPHIDNGNIYARGATDDKGQSFAHVKAVEAFMQAQGELPVNVIFLIEGEEEIHSENLDTFLVENKDELKADMALISDTSQYAPGLPSIVYGLRGICAEEFHVEGAAQDLHSGIFGGAVPNPAITLCQMIAKLKDEKGRIKVPGFYDDVLPLEEWEKKAFAELPWNESDFQKSLGLEGLHGEEGYSSLERRWARPTLDVNGIFGGYAGEGSKTVIPCWAGVKITMRLVPNQTPKKIHELFEEYVKEIAPSYVRVKFIDWGGCGPVLVPRDALFMNQAEEAFDKGFGHKPCFIREGGSIPVVLALKEILGLNTILMGFGRNDDNLHAPNEKFSLDDFERGIKTSAWFLHLCGNKINRILT